MSPRVKAKNAENDADNVDVPGIVPGAEESKKSELPTFSFSEKVMAKGAYVQGVVTSAQLAELQKSGRLVGYHPASKTALYTEE